MGFLELVSIFAAATQLFKPSAPSKQQKFINPLPSGRITSKFGRRTHPTTHEPNKMHNGIDIAAPSGTTIIAPADGLVTGRNTTDIGGNQLFIVHDNGLQTGYSHLSGYLVETGTRVKQGDPIAKVGTTGRSTGPHLHWSVKNVKKEFLDPEKYM